MMVIICPTSCHYNVFVETHGFGYSICNFQYITGSTTGSAYILLFSYIRDDDSNIIHICIYVYVYMYIYKCIYIDIFIY